MKLAHLSVRNYRALNRIDIPLSGFVCLTGENNAGKSSVLQALSLFLSGTGIPSHSFFNPAQEVTIALTLSEVQEEDLNLLSPEHRPRIAALVKDGKVTFVRRYTPDGGKGQMGYFGQVPTADRFQPKFIENLTKGKKPSAAFCNSVLESYPELEGKVTTSTTLGAVRSAIEVLGEGQPSEEKETKFVPLPTGDGFSIAPMLPERIYIPAVKDPNDETKVAESSSFGKILRIVTSLIEPQLAGEKGFFDDLSKKLTRIRQANGAVTDNRLKEIKEIESLLQGFVRESFSSVKLEIEIPPPDLKTILSTARILVDDGIKGGLDLKGDGLRRAVVFAILRTYVDLTSKQSDAAAGKDRGYILLFEEPELFLHPDAQRVLFEALGVFSKKHHVLVTTHSPLFLGPNRTATFVRLSKTATAEFDRPFTEAQSVDLTGIDAKDEFQIICFENNNAAFFARRVVLVEGDSDVIVYPHIAQLLDPDWVCSRHSIAFARVGGKTSIRRYRNFFQRFGVEVHVITDLDILEDGFDQLDPCEACKNLRQDLFKELDRVVAGGEKKEPNGKALAKAQGSTALRALWGQVCKARETFEADPTQFDVLDSAVKQFFAFEKKSARRSVLEQAADKDVFAAKTKLIAKLRERGVFVLSRGAIDDYYPSDLPPGDKPTRAQKFCENFVERAKIVGLCGEEACPKTGEDKPEFELIFRGIFQQN